MVEPGLKFKRWLRWGVCALVCSLLAFGCASTDTARDTDWAVYEWKFPSRSEAEPHVAIIDIDDRSLAAQGGWPLDRSLYVKVAKRALSQGAVAVVFDIMFDRELSQEGDRLLVELARTDKRVQFAYQARPDELTRPRFFRDLALAAPSAGYIDAVGGAEPRVVTMIADIPGEASLAFLAASTYCQSRRSCHPQIRSSTTDMVYRTRKVAVWGIDFHAPFSTFPRVSLSRVLAGHSAPFRGKVVIISPSAESLGDMYWIPQGHKRVWQPGSVALAYGIETAISGKSPFVMPATLVIAALSAANLLLCGLASRLKKRLNILFGAYLALLVAAHWLLFAFLHLHVPLTLCMGNGLAMLACGVLGWLDGRKGG